MSIFKNNKFKFLLPLMATIAFIPSCNSNYKDYAFKYWNSGSSISTLKDYVQRVTDPKNEKYIPKEDRIVSCDINGTLYGERATYYAEYMMFPWYYDKFIEGKTIDEKRALDERTITLKNENPNGHGEEIIIQMAQVINAMKEYIKVAPSQKAPNVLDYRTEKQDQNIYVSLATAENHMAALLFSYKIDPEMTDIKYFNIVDNFLKEEVTKFTNTTFKNMFYKPMIEVINYLTRNDFTIYVVSNSDRLFVRELVKNNIELNECIPTHHIVGLDVDMKDDSEHKRIYRGDMLLPRTKVQAIGQEIGKKPVLSFGNSLGSDGPMNDYCLRENKYESQAYMVLADDMDREYGDNEETINKLKNKFTDLGYKMFSMKNDWKTIYGDNVTKKS